MQRYIFSLSLGLNLLIIPITVYISYKMGYLGRFMIAMTGNNLIAPTDTLSSQPQWQDAVQYQQTVVDQQKFQVCLFGDSISAQIENTLGNDTFNFALPGMSTISQLEQLNALKSAQTQCETAIMAIGTNDAAYRTTPEQFERNLTQILTDLRQQMHTQTIILLPAFYSTVAASRDRSIAGTVERIELINQRIQQVAQRENIPVPSEVTAPLFSGQALQEDLTFDGIHLNLKGKQIYRTSLLRLINQYH
jgi:lysophospholipase L1-like esterase